MWFGTRNKLNRYDGNTFKIFDCYDYVAQKQNNNISSLFEDREKHLWVGTDKGVFILDPQTEIFTYMNTQTAEGITMTDWISDIGEDRDGNIWIVVPNQGLFRYIQDSKELKFYAFGKKTVPDHGNPQSMCIDQSNRVWIGTNGKGVYLYDKQTDEFTQYLGDTNGNTLAGENIYLFRTEDPDVVLKWDSGGASIGDYLTGLLENRVPAQQKEGVTLRQVYHQWYQDGALLSLPQITLVDGELEVFLE